MSEAKEDIITLRDILICLGKICIIRESAGKVISMLRKENRYDIETMANLEERTELANN